jgi:hypothetical protein
VLIELGAAELPADRWGNKASRLNTVVRCGIAVPPALCVHASSAQLAPPAVAAWLGCHRPDAVAVRTSSALEDTAEAARAGRTVSRLNVPADPEAVQRVIVEDILPVGDPAPDGLSVIIQQQVRAEIAGVAFATSAGLFAEFSRAGTDVVTAGGTPQGRLERGGEGRAIASGEMAPFVHLERALSHTCDRLREVFGFGVDVEWAWLAGALVILQVRPITADVAWWRVAGYRSCSTIDEGQAGGGGP